MVVEVTGTVGAVVVFEDDPEPPQPLRRTTITIEIAGVGAFTDRNVAPPEGARGRSRTEP